MLIFMLIFMVQYVNFQEIHHKQLALGSIVENHSQQARMEGFFTTAIKESMINQINKETGIDKAEIKTTLTESLKCTRASFSADSQISYIVQIPMKNVIAGAKFLGINEADNMYWYSLEGNVSSEKLCDS